MSRLYFGGSDSEDSTDENALPYPQPLARTSFLTPDFSATNFLSSLHDRHQTLEDLRLELRTRSQELNKELLDLVNDNYQDFLGLGSSLKGGEEKVEEVKLGLMRFMREVDGLKSDVSARRTEVEGLFEDRKKVAREIRKGEDLLDVNNKLEELEEALRIRANGVDGSNGNEELSDFTESDESEDDDELERTISTTRLKRRVQQFVYLKRLIEKIGASHPFLSKLEDRVAKVRQTLVLDLNHALAEGRRLGGSEGTGTLRVLALYRSIDEPDALIPALKGQKNL